MSVVVTLHVFSGRPNPAWELTSVQARELSARLRAVTDRTTLKPPGISGALGYRGFTITSIGEPDLESEIYVHAGIADLARYELNLALNSPDLESWLLSTAGNSVDNTVANVVTRELSNVSLMSLGRRPGFFTIPPYDPGKWNNESTIRTRNNCYNYGNDKITNTFAQPGKGSGQMYSSIDCGNVSSAARRDGQISIPNPNITPAEGHIIALVIAPGYDYHWYRRDSNGMWSHKPGQTPARNTDNSGNAISNPETCDRGPYTDFCGYFHCIPANTRII
ncbi:hypothetical protein [Sinorhizobium meliloti]|uniref:hypothetical protein n=1 Tax=Rhizobium meliloti TaxID=382 RepID=UPI000FDBB0A2|nr:hypothetical protein [Sinorhizobium meliloti]RVG20629.1 hypothetical protein CN231_04355 [Sinorhizobium meliloti]